MKKIIIIYLLSLTCLTAQAQWKQINNSQLTDAELPFVGAFQDVRYFDEDTIVLSMRYYATTPPARSKQSLYVSHNGGQSWNKTHADTVASFTTWFHSAKTANFFHYAGTPPTWSFAFSSDAGNNVSYVADLPSNLKGSFTFITSQVGFGFENSTYKDTLYRTADTGKTWQDYTGGYEAFKTLPVFINKNIGYVIAYKSIVADLLKTTDGGKTWAVSIKDMLNQLTYGNTSFFAASEDVFYATSVSYPTGDFKRVFKSIDGGKTWKSMSKGLDTTGNLKNEYIYFSSPDYGFVIDNRGFVYRTTDGGANWGYQDRLYDKLAIDKIECLNDTVCWAWKSGIPSYFFTTNGGGIVVGIDEQAPAGRQELLLYPNPASGKLQVKMPGMGSAQLSVYDMLGREAVVPIVSRRSDGVELDIAALQPGVYVLRVQDGKRLSMGRFVVK